MPNDEIIEMRQAADGKYYADSVVKVPSPNRRTNPEATEIVFGTPIGKAMSKFYQFLQGFEMGLGAMERFFEVMNKYQREYKK